METLKLEGKYNESIGRRKRAIARVRFYPGKGKIVVNGKEFKNYFPTEKLQNIVLGPLVTVARQESFDIGVQVVGGGSHGQAEAVRMGIARCLLDEDEEMRSTLKKSGFLSRDSRRRERKKPGKRSARRSPQWSKR